MSRRDVITLVAAVTVAAIWYPISHLATVSTSSGQDATAILESDGFTPVTLPSLACVNRLVTSYAGGTAPNSDLLEVVLVFRPAYVDREPAIAARNTPYGISVEIDGNVVKVQGTQSQFDLVPRSAGLSC